MLDRVAVVARDPDTTGPGRLVYDGPAYPDAIHFFNPPAAGGPASRPEGEPSPDDLLRGLARRPVGEWVERLAAIRGRTGGTPHHVPAAPRARPIVVRYPRTSGGHRSRSGGPSSRRNVARKRKDAWNTAILLAQAPIIALLIVLVFGRQARPGTLADLEHWTEAASGVASTTFILGLAALWFGCSNAVREIVGEWPVYQRERMVNLKLGPYIASKLATLGGLCLFQCAILLAIAHFGIGLKGGPADDIRHPGPGLVRRPGPGPGDLGGGANLGGRDCLAPADDPAPADLRRRHAAATQDAPGSPVRLQRLPLALGVRGPDRARIGPAADGPDPVGHGTAESTAANAAIAGHGRDLLPGRDRPDGAAGRGHRAGGHVRLSGRAHRGDPAARATCISRADPILQPFEPFPGRRMGGIVVFNVLPRFTGASFGGLLPAERLCASA